MTKNSGSRQGASKRKGSTKSPRSRRTTALINVLLIAGLVIVAVFVIVAIQSQRNTPVAETAAPITIIRDDTHVLDDPAEPKAELVEFLDFECEACGAFKEHVEAIREEFDGQITFAIRYFPLPSHGNSMNAAIAAEAAAQQDQLEAMYYKLFDTQGQWGEKGGESQAGLFRTFAEELGLDMEAYDRAVADPATAQRVQSDFEDGRALGIQSTPTFFLNGEVVELTAFEDLHAAVAAAVSQ